MGEMLVLSVVLLIGCLEIVFRVVAARLWLNVYGGFYGSGCGAFEILAFGSLLVV